MRPGSPSGTPCRRISRSTWPPRARRQQWPSGRPPPCRRHWVAAVVRRAPPEDIRPQALCSLQLTGPRRLGSCSTACSAAEASQMPSPPLLEAAGGGDLPPHLGRGRRCPRARTRRSLRSTMPPQMPHRAHATPRELRHPQHVPANREPRPCKMVASVIRCSASCRRTHQALDQLVAAT